jgi:superfamily I DNA and/or RNA helicase
MAGTRAVAAAAPAKTLGVAAFSKARAQRVEDELELLRRQDPSCEAFFAAHPEEPFFVKNLENVQGDERDVIMISVGYGRTAEGYVAMQFGPLLQDGGWRRLNVLITRARERCEIFSNLTADDIDLSRTQSRGVPPPRCS